MRLLVVLFAAAACGAGVDARAASDGKPGTVSDGKPGASSVSAPPPTTRDLTRYEGGAVASVEVVIEEAMAESAMLAEFRGLLRIAPGARFSAVLIRESLQALFDSERVARARVEASDAPGERDSEGRPPVAL
ncbi:MAG TPA: hypothetical protein VGV38_19945, partial [Pyrinomonadaceae bacterium]|nr:hypothetical protein [Pyrinomonadaceae bacterium]